MREYLATTVHHGLKLAGVDRDRAVVGLIGQVTVPTRGTAGAGEVLLLVRGAPEAYLAWSETALPRGAKVLVVDIRGARTVDVVAWDGKVQPTS